MEWTISYSSVYTIQPQGWWGLQEKKYSWQFNMIWLIIYIPFALLLGSRFFADFKLGTLCRLVHCPFDRFSVIICFVRSRTRIPRLVSTDTRMCPDIFSGDWWVFLESGQIHMEILLSRALDCPLKVFKKNVTAELQEHNFRGHRRLPCGGEV